jgi:hypothetical protein
MFGRHSIRGFLGFGLLMAITSCALGQGASVLVKVSYSLRAKKVSLGEPIVLTYTLVNRGSASVRVDLGQDRKGSFAFTVIRPDQQELRLAAFSRDGISVPGLVSVASGQSFSEDLILNEWYQFPVPGEYRIAARVTEPVLDEDNRSVLADGGAQLRLTIGARDVVQLGYVCAVLVDRLAKAGSYSEAADAAQELSYVVDPVAVPYLKSGLALGKLVEPILITGLERIGEDSAAQALIGTLKTGSSDTQLLARSALRRIYGTTVSDALRNQIQKVLADADNPPR